MNFCVSIQYTLAAVMENTVFTGSKTLRTLQDSFTPMEAGMISVRGNPTHKHTCVYNLPMENLNPSHAGTYFCAVASCGHILFGNGTKLDFEGKQITQLFNEK
ncbi:hypothetical protein F7725_004332 [Dissostichus mawsoni]|uniref:Uncharacterized protein n=1 Tax=Dissostichus mawsoni TaxID=36200 RepID=A0A7J5XL16_DISMA|nr:hypothetical protein F7725_004332 [Dissostichus mawsoni]